MYNLFLSYFPDYHWYIYISITGSGQPTVFVAVAGRSNGLGPVTSGNCAYPVINCPPVTADWGREDIWSSLRLPSGMSSFYSISVFWNSCCRYV